MRDDMKSMEQLLKTDRSLRHRETALNLTGWCYKLEGNSNKAIQYFVRSLALEKQHNAAFWHLLVTSYELFLKENKTLLFKLPTK